MNGLPVVSVIMPVRDLAAYVGQSIGSVLEQTWRNFELIVVDDGSTDGTASVAETAGDPRVRVLRRGAGGVSAARNAGLAAARGTYVAFLDGDDLWDARALELLLEPLLSGGAQVSWGDFTRFEDGTDRHLPLPWTDARLTGRPYWDMLVDNCLHLGAVCVRAALARTTPFDVTLACGEDRDWFLRLFRSLPDGAVRHVPRVVLYYRQRRGSAVRDRARFLRDEQRVLDSYVDDPAVPAWIRRRALSSADFHAAVLLAGMPGNRARALRRYLRALIRDPLYLENVLRPLRKMFLRGQGVLSLPCGGSGGGADPLVSLVIATRGRRKELWSLLDSLRRQDFRNFEVIIVDQNPEGFLGELKEHAQGLNMRRLPFVAGGASAARNAGLDAARGEIVGFPDDDCLYAADTLRNVVEIFRRYPSWGGVLGVWSGIDAAENAPRGGAVTPPIRLNRYSAFRRGETYVQFFRRAAVRAVRGFDVRLGPGAPPFFGSAEDTDYLLRIMKAGVDVGRTPCIRLFHPEVRYDMPNLDRKACAYGLTRMFLLKKHRFPLWFQWINLLYPLILLPWETLRRGRGAAIYRYASFRGRFQGLRDVISCVRTL